MFELAFVRHRPGKMNTSKVFPAKLQNWLVQLFPLIAAILLAALWRQQGGGGRTLAGFVQHVVMLALVSLPFLMAHLSALRVRLILALPIWLAGFALYPVAIHSLVAPDIYIGSLPTVPESVIAAAFSAAALLTGRRAGYRLRAGGMAALMRRMPVTLDGSVIALLAVWALATTSLFASTADAVHNQPLTVWFDPWRIAAHPGEAAAFLLQFMGVALLLYGLYWGCRYVLVRRVLSRQGWIYFALASLSYWIVATPLMGSLILLLPVNLSDWSILPSENHDPFDPVNYGFTFIVLVIIMPIVLASERLLAEQRDVSGRHARVRTELDLLQQQINPHFLFNSLNAVYALCLQDRAASADAVLKLSELLHYTVYEGRREQVRLDEEVAYLRNYLDLQLLRLGDRCELRCDWPVSTESFTIPPLLLIMLVENAFKHGIEPADGAGRISIEMGLSGSTMCFVCENSLGSGPVGGLDTGFGLDNLRRRLELLYGHGYRLKSGHNGTLWRAELELELGEC